MRAISDLTSSLKVAHQSLSYQLVFIIALITTEYILILFVLLFIIYLLLECKYHESKELAYFIHRCIPWA